MLRSLQRVTALAVLSFSASLPAQEPTFTSNAVEHLAWRELGPANPMGRMTDIAIHDAEQSTWFVGTAGGGVFRTKNAGTTWDNVFANYGTASIGDVAIAPSDRSIVWVGTGEENARNSVQWGDGIYKSTDGGDTFVHMGLRETFQIGHIEVHPSNPDIVYVAALGRLWSESEARGVYRTKDGGNTWERVLYVDDKTGCIDVRVHPRDPMTVFACLYERKRDRFDGNDPSVRFGQHSGIYKSVDGGENWRQLTEGLPSCTWGRSGIDLLQSNPDTMFAIIETERSGWQSGDHKDRMSGDPTEPETPSQGAGQGGAGQGAAGGRGGQGRAARGTAVMGIGSEGQSGEEDAPGAIFTTITAEGPAEKAGLQVGDRITKVDDETIASYDDLIELVRDSRARQTLKITFVRDGEEQQIELVLGERPNQVMQAAGKPNGPYSGRLFGQEANKHKQQGDLGFETGGIFRSDDRGATWTRLNSLTERPFYYSVIRVDPQNADNIYAVGTNFWGSSDGGEKFATLERGIHVDFHGIWVDPDDSDHLIAICDGGINETYDRGRSWQVHTGFSAAQYYDCAVDNAVPYNVVGGLQDNGTWVVPSQTRYRDGITFADIFKIYGGDGFGAQTDPIEPHIVYATSQNGAAGIVNTRNGRTARLQRGASSDGGRADFNWDAPFILSPHNRLTLYHAGNYVWRGERHSHLDNRGSRPNQGPTQNERGVRMACVSPRLGATERGTATAIAESPIQQGLIYVGTDDGALWCTKNGGTDWHRIDASLPTTTPLYVSDIVPSHFKAGRVYLTLDGHRSDDFATHVLLSEDMGTTWYDLGETLPGQLVCHAIAEDPRNENLLFLGTEHGCWTSLDRGYNWLTLGNGMPNTSVRELAIQDRDSDLVAATHGRGLMVLDIEALRQLSSSIVKQSAHLFAVQPAYLWQLSGRDFQGHKHFAAKNPAYGVTFYLWLNQEPAEAPVLTIHDVTGKEIATVTGKKTVGVQPIQWDARSNRQLAKPGTYAVRLKGQDDQKQAFELRADPAIAASSNNPSQPTSNR